MLLKRIGGKEAAVMKDLVQFFLLLKMCLHVLSVVFGAMEGAVNKTVNSVIIR